MPSPQPGSGQKVEANNEGMEMLCLDDFMVDANGNSSPDHKEREEGTITTRKCSDSDGIFLIDSLGPSSGENGFEWDWEWENVINGGNEVCGQEENTYSWLWDNNESGDGYCDNGVGFEMDMNENHSAIITWLLS
ncbi:Hypothetical predicted protein [Olea europaea subsp. europaea]|uniref:Uncharacterized protein n=1 Tax=Olea europaea subsp. europaea TaxID=158383 RepID=A0A8S0PZ67_OLEEU|nr:Hypothetical predicted protein [Olea europaea subsp. europaea]